MIAVIDYGMGNLASVLNALRPIAPDAAPVVGPDGLAEADGIVLPGVGAFGDAMRRLGERGLDAAIVAAAERGTPLLGICLGMQLLATTGFEFGEHRGLGLVPGEVRPIPAADGLRIPHMGWNDVEEARGVLLDGAVAPTFYFVHSYALVADDPAHVTGVVEYGTRLTAVVERGNVLGVQFHPEKSQDDGLLVLRNFARLCREPAVAAS
jgi:glutamine amidotransferase